MKLKIKSARCISVLVCISVFVVLFQSCNKDSNINGTIPNNNINGILSTTEMQNKVMTFIYLKDNKYSLKLTRDEALEQGFTIAFYEKTKIEMLNLNAAIQVALLNKNVEMSLIDFQKKLSGNNKVRLKSETIEATGSYLTLYPTLGEPAEGSFETKLKDVKMVATSQCLFHLFSGTLVEHGQTHTFSFFGNTTISMKMTPATCTVKIFASCSGDNTVKISY